MFCFPSKTFNMLISFCQRTTLLIKEFSELLLTNWCFSPSPSLSLSLPPPPSLPPSLPLPLSPPFSLPTVYPKTPLARTASGHDLNLRRVSNFEESVNSVTSYNSMFEEIPESSDREELSPHPSPSLIPLLDKTKLEDFTERKSASLPNLAGQKPTSLSGLMNSWLRSNEPTLPPKLEVISEDGEQVKYRIGEDEKRRENRSNDTAKDESDKLEICSGTKTIQLGVNGDLQIHCWHDEVSKRTNTRLKGLDTCEPGLGASEKLNSVPFKNDGRLDSGISCMSANDNSSQIDLSAPVFPDEATPSTGERSENESRGGDCAGCPFPDSKVRGKQTIV